MNNLLSEQQALLAEKLLIMQRLHGGLAWSLERLPACVDVQAISDPAVAERTAAVVDRFCKLQDQFAGALRQAHAMLGEKYRSFHDVVTWAVNERLLPDEPTWLELRSLRNRLTHEYDPANDALPELIQSIRDGHALLATAIHHFQSLCTQRGLVPTAPEH